MSRSQKRPPRLEPRVHATPVATPPTLEALLERAKIAGPAAPGPGPTEFRRNVELLVAGDRRALGEIAPIAGLVAADAWKAVAETFGASPDLVMIEAQRTIAAIRAARERVCDVAATGARIAIATSAPASLVTLHLAFARLAREHGGEVVDLADFGPIRADGRHPRWLRWVGGVAVVSDGDGLCATRDGEVAREWFFALPRPALAIADGPFAEVAWESGVEVVAFAGLDRLALAVAAATARRETGMVVPMRTDRATRAYRVLEELVAGAGAAPTARPSDRETGL
ncbi:MAG: hypothetical protein JWM72_2043 [Actinomycetia bacterium]|nr:hypothetical protein [Actinomycetes bacterium]